jgi:hypothetical protein
MLAGLQRPHNRMMSGAKMFRCVLVLGGVAAAHLSAGETNAEMDPTVTDFQTVFATWSTWLNVADLFQVGASGHRIHCSFGWRFFGKRRRSCSFWTLPWKWEASSVPRGSAGALRQMELNRLPLPENASSAELTPVAVGFLRRAAGAMHVPPKHHARGGSQMGGASFASMRRRQVLKQCSATTTSFI